MIPNRESGADRPNEELLELDPYGEPAPEPPAPETAAAERSTAPEPSAPETSPGAGEEQGNVDWLGRSELRTGILLLGGTSLADFRVRVAQSQLRSDLTPSYWSMCGLLGEDGTVRTVPLQPADIGAVPVTNAVRAMPMSDFDDAQAWPNIAVLRFAEGTAAIDEHVTTAMRRTVVDLPALLLAWLGFVWGVGDNPLVGGQGVPSAVFVETCYGLAGIELTPGLSSSASCPEAIWQAVKWWHDYYAGVAEIGASEAGSVRPSGSYLVRQPSAQMAITER